MERSLHYAQINGQSCPWPLNLMTSQAVERIPRTGVFRRFRGEWVKARGEIRKKCPWDVGLSKIEKNHRNCGIERKCRLELRDRRPHWHPHVTSFLTNASYLKKIPCTCFSDSNSTFIDRHFFQVASRTYRHAHGDWFTCGLHYFNRPFCLLHVEKELKKHIVLS